VETFFETQCIHVRIVIHAVTLCCILSKAKSSNILCWSH